MARRRSRALYVISVAAEIAGIHPQTLRLWERKGLVEPYRTPGGTRRYSEEDIERLTLIQSLTNEGLNLEGVRRVMDMQDTIERLESEVAVLRDEVQATRRLVETAERRIHRSYRREIVLRRTANPPDLRR